MLPEVVIASGLSSRSAYSCTALAITHAGRGERSQITRAETLAVPPAVDHVTVTRRQIADGCKLQETNDPHIYHIAYHY